jgi:hypothetical protein
MSQAKSVGQGFIAVASIISLFITAIWLLNAYLSLWIGVPLFLFLAVPFAINCFSLFKEVNEKKPVQTQVKQAKNVLMALPGAGFACWFFDVLSTILVINLAQSGAELNPLGWPYSAPAALAYYIPITFVTYYLLFKIKKPASFWVAVAISAATLFMSARNFLAILNNFGPGIFTRYSSSPSITNLEILCTWSAVVIILAVLNIVAIKAKNKSLI